MAGISGDLSYRMKCGQPLYLTGAEAHRKQVHPSRCDTPPYFPCAMVVAIISSIAL